MELSQMPNGDISFISVIHFCPTVGPTDVYLFVLSTKPMKRIYQQYFSQFHTFANEFVQTPYQLKM